MGKNIPYFVEGSLQGIEWDVICKVFTIPPGTKYDLDKMVVIIITNKNIIN